MPALDSNDLLMVRTFPQSVIRHCSFAERTAVFSGQVNGAPTLDSVSGGVVSFSFDNTTGSSGAIERDATIEFGTTAGAKDVGVSRVRKPVSGSTMFIAETALAALKIENNIFFTVYDEIRPWAKLPRLVGVKNNSNLITSFTEYHDYDRAYSDQNDDIQPIVIISRSATSRRSPEPAGMVDVGQIYRTLSLSAFFSHAAADGGVSIASYSWSVGDCTITVGGPTSQTITLQAPIGFRLIKLTVVDSNGTSASMYFPIWAHDDTIYPPYDNFTVTADTRSTGRVMSFEFFGEDDYLADVYEGQLMCYWEEASNPPYTAMPDDYISSFMGWATRDSEELKLFDRTTYRLDVAGTQFWLNSFSGFAQKLKETGPLGTVNRWFKFPFSTLTVDRTTHYILREYTNILKLANFHWSGITNRVQAEEWKKASVWQQITELQAGNEQCQVVCDSLGAIWVRNKYEYLDLADRVGVDIIVNLDKQDWTDAQGLNITYEYANKINIVNASGSKVNPSTNKNVLQFAKAPGLVPAQSGNDDEMPFQRLRAAGSIVKLCKLAGNHWAALNNPRGEVTLELVGNYDFAEIAWGEPVTITWVDNSLRGTVVNTEEFIITNISVSHSNEKGTAPKTITWTLKQATVGEPGIQYFPPKTDGKTTLPSIKFPKINIPNYTPSDWVNLPPSVPGVGIFTGGASGDFLYRATDFNSLGTFERVNMGLAGFGACFKVDPYSPLYLGTGTTVNGWVLTTTNIYRIVDIFAVSPTIMNVRTLDNVINFAVHDNSLLMNASLRLPSWVMVLANISGGVDLYWTTDGTTWTLVDIDSGLGMISTTEYYPFVYASPTIGGLGYASFRDTAGTGLAYIFRTIDYGASWIDITPAAGDCKRVLHIPSASNPNSLIVYYEDMSGNVVKWDSALDEVIDTFALPAVGEVATLKTSPKNVNKLIVVMSSSSNFIYASRNGGKLFTTIEIEYDVSQVYMNSTHEDTFYVVNPIALIAMNVLLTKNFGVSFEDLSGNLDTFSSPPAVGFIGWAGTL